MILLGLNPAFRENGFAVAMYDPTDLFEPLRFVIFRNAGCFIGWLVNDAPALAFACVENSNLDPAVYHLSPKMTVRMAAAVGIRVGKNQAISQLAVDLLRNRYGKHNVLEVSPSKKGGKVYPARVAAVDVIDLTGEYALLNGISKGEAWELLRNLHAKETAAYRVLVNSLKNYL